MIGKEAKSAFPPQGVAKETLRAPQELQGTERIPDWIQTFLREMSDFIADVPERRITLSEAAAYMKGLTHLPKNDVDFIRDFTRRYRIVPTEKVMRAGRYLIHLPNKQAFIAFLLIGGAASRKKRHEGKQNIREIALVDVVENDLIASLGHHPLATVYNTTSLPDARNAEKRRLHYGHTRDRERRARDEQEFYRLNYALLRQVTPDVLRAYQRKLEDRDKYPQLGHLPETAITDNIRGLMEIYETAGKKHFQPFDPSSRELTYAELREAVGFALSVFARREDFKTLEDIYRAADRSVPRTARSWQE